MKESNTFKFTTLSNVEVDINYTPIYHSDTLEVIHTSDVISMNYYWTLGNSDYDKDPNFIEAHSWNLMDEYLSSYFIFDKTKNKRFFVSLLHNVFFELEKARGFSFDDNDHTILETLQLYKELRNVSWFDDEKCIFDVSIGYKTNKETQINAVNKSIDSCLHSFYTLCKTAHKLSEQKEKIRLEKSRKHIIDEESIKCVYDNDYICIFRIIKNEILGQLVPKDMYDIFDAKLYNYDFNYFPDISYLTKNGGIFVVQDRFRKTAILYFDKLIFSTSDNISCQFDDVLAIIPELKNINWYTLDTSTKLKLVYKESITYDERTLYINECPSSIYYMNDVSLEHQKLAISKTSFDILYNRTPHKEVQDIVVHENISNFVFIQDPYRELILTVFKQFPKIIEKEKTSIRNHLKFLVEKSSKLTNEDKLEIRMAFS